ncbi:MAG: tetratricopeptide repeat protein, partial [Nitrospinae bacterium]|nr:tetratricopeptide repeat protein [Nitrospinota bacterium]
AINPNDPDAHYNLGNAYAELKKPREAVESYQSAIRLKPNFSTARVNLGIAFKELGRVDLAIASYRNAIAADPNNADALYNLANALEAEDLQDEAVECYRRAILLSPNHARAHHNLGNALAKRGTTGEAIDCYQRAVQLDPENDAAKHMLASLKGQITETAPPKYVRTLFDNCAEKFEERLVDQLSYKSPMEIRRAFDGFLKGGQRFVSMIDLGCGSGLAGQEFRGIADRQTGIDIAPKMIEVARRKNVYDVLLTGDIVETLNRLDEKYDLFLATDVLVYIGNLRPLFGAVQAHALSGAYFAFSTESQEGQEYALRPTGRYAHSFAYLQSLANEYGFTVEYREPAVIRVEKGRNAMGDHVVMRYAR